jgi:hypothetical protein
MEATITLRMAAPADLSTILHHRHAMFSDMHIGTSIDSGSPLCRLERTCRAAATGLAGQTPDGQVVGAGC